MTRALILSVAVAFVGCSKEPPEIKLVAAPPEPPRYAAECVSKDKPFPTLPDRDISLDEAARDRRLAKDRYGELLDKRVVCRDSLLAQAKK